MKSGIAESTRSQTSSGQPMNRIRLKSRSPAKQSPSFVRSASNTAAANTKPLESLPSYSHEWIRDPAEIGSPDAWLYVSRRLDLEWLPNTSLWAAAALTIGPTAYYRLSATVLVWLEVAGERLEGQWRMGTVARQQLDEYLLAMDVVREFARMNLSGEAVRSQRARPPTLPDAPQPK